jgi:hypothetical protein
MMSSWILKLYILGATFLSLPTFGTLTPLSESNGTQPRELDARAIPAAPHFVVYGDAYVSGQTGPPPASSIKVCQVALMVIIEGTERHCVLFRVSLSSAHCLDFRYFAHVRLNSAMSSLLLEGAWDKVVYVVSSSLDDSRVG